MGTDDLETDLARNAESAPRELLTRSFLFLYAALSVATTLNIVGLLISEVAKSSTLTALLVEVVGETVFIIDFLTGVTWQICGQEFGVLALASATLMVTIGSAAIALPLDVVIAIYPDEYASAQAHSILKPALEILVGVPTVVYGSFALVYIAPALEIAFPGIGAFSMLSTSIVVGIMIILMIASINEDAISVVPNELRQTGYGMDATKFDVSTDIIVPVVLSGIFSSFILTLFRTIDETMAVTVATGAQVKFLNPLNPASYLGGVLSVTAAMAQLLIGDITDGRLAYHNLFAIGLALFVITPVMNATSDYVSRRYREAY